MRSVRLSVIETKYLVAIYEDKNNVSDVNRRLLQIREWACRAEPIDPGEPHE